MLRSTNSRVNVQPNKHYSLIGQWHAWPYPQLTAQVIWVKKWDHNIYLSFCFSDMLDTTALSLLLFAKSKRKWIDGIRMRSCQIIREITCKNTSKLNLHFTSTSYSLFWQPCCLLTFMSLYKYFTGFFQHYRRFHPEESYSTPVKALKPDDLDRMGISTNPLNTLGKMPLPDAQRLSCYLECNLKECPRGDTEICRSS